MKRIISILISVFLLSSCFKDYNEDFLITQKTVEFEDAVTTSVASGKNYPILSNIFSLHGVVSYRINMFGEQSPVPQQIAYRIVEDETTAIENIDYKFTTDKYITVPANSSFGYLQLEVLNSISGNRVLVVELLGNDNVNVSPNYSTIGIPMSNAVLSPDPNVVEDKGDYLHITELTLGGDANPNIGSFLDMQTANIYNWESAALFSDKATIAYLHSGSNFANFVFPGLGSMSTAWPTYYNRILNWDIAPTGIVVRYTNVTAQDNSLYDNITSASDIETAYHTAVANVGTRHGAANTYGPGERVRSLTNGDLVFVYSSTHNFYVIIRVVDAIQGNPTPNSEHRMKFEYKVQK